MYIQLLCKLQRRLLCNLRTYFVIFPASYCKPHITNILPIIIFRYYRKPPNSSLHRRPSALCLPITCHPDPASRKRSKKTTSEQTVSSQDHRCKHLKKCEQESLMKIHNEVYVTRSQLDSTFDKYEEVIEMEVDKPSYQVPSKNVIKLLKPRVRGFTVVI